MRRMCDACRKPYEAKTPRSKFCSDGCRNRAFRNPRLAQVTALTPPEPAVATEGGSVATVAERTSVRIAELGLESDPAAAVAMVLAKRLDSDSETGAAVASLARQYALVLEDLGKRGKRAADPLDQIRERMMSKGQSA